jgi:hypothetical protein
LCTPDLFDEQAKEILRLLRALVGEDLVEFVGEVGEGGRVRRIGEAELDLETGRRAPVVRG